jgi:outer membrane protein OmpA-like peptidoglycan-associated protein
MKFRGLAFIMAIFITSTIWAQDLERQGTFYFNSHEYEKAEKIFLEVLAKNPESIYGNFSMAKLKYEEERELRKKESQIQKYKNFQEYIDLLKVAYKYSQKAALAYKKLEEPEKATLRKLVTATDADISTHLSSTIEKEYFEILRDAKYRKPTKILFGSKIYSQTIDADTINFLKKAFFEQCNQYLETFKQSPYEPMIRQFRKELMLEYITLEDLRQFGDKSGGEYEKYCTTVLQLFTPEELKHIVPNFYGMEYGWKKEFQTHDRYLKVKSLAESNKLSVEEFLCKLSLHYKGCTEENITLYQQLIQAIAPTDVAWVAVQKVASFYAFQGQWAKAKEVYKTYQALFPEHQRLFEKSMILMDDNSEPIKLENLGDGVNSAEKEYYPVLTMDEKTLYFARKTADYGEDVFVSEKLPDGRWGVATQVNSQLNTQSHEIPLSISADANTLFLYGNYAILPQFSYLKNEEKRLGKGDFYLTKRQEGGWGKVEVFKYPVNTTNYEAGLSITADGNAILFASDREGAIGGYNPNYPTEWLYYHGSGEFNLDIWVSVKKEDGTWGQPINLGSTINTPFAEKNPYLHPDMKTLYFCSDGHEGFGGYDIMMSKRLDENSWTSWSEPVNIGKSINSPHDDAFYITATGKKALFVSNQKDNNFGSTDIYQVEVPKKFRPDPVAVITGKIVDEDGKGSSATIHWEENGKKKIGKIPTSTIDGKYTLVLNGGAKYTLIPEKDKHFGSSTEIDLTNLKEGTIITQDDRKIHSLDIEDEKRKPFILETLHFDTDSDRIRPESFYDLDRLAKILLQSPQIKVIIEGHTDNMASHEYNIDLSQRRTGSVKKYLISKGVAENRLESNGYGETKPIAPNTTNDGRQKNRRVEFRVVGI